MVDLSANRANHPSVSVIIPCYNAGAELLNAIQSVRAQTYPVSEIIVINDGSTSTATEELLSSLGSGVVVINQINKGLGAARNTGYDNVTSEYVLPLDCDDTIHPEYIETCFKVLADNPAATYAFADLNLTGEKSGVLRKSYNLFEQLFTNQLPYCILVPKSIWEKVGGYDDKMPAMGYEDWDFNIRLGLAGYYGVSIQKPYFNYHVSQTGMLQSISTKNHAVLWQYIQSKYAKAYKISNMIQLYFKWRRYPSSYPVVLYICMYLAFKLMPNKSFNFLFQWLKKYTATERFSTNQ